VSELELKLLNAATEYDRLESTKRHYNPYALAQYLARITEVVADVDNGADVRAAIVAGFNGRLCAKLLKAAGQSGYTKQDAMGGMVYRPAGKQK
jgi:hypothetical protein